MKHMLNISPGKTFLHLSLDEFHHKLKECTRCCIYLATSRFMTDMLTPVLYHDHVFVFTVFIINKGSESCLAIATE